MLYDAKDTSGWQPAAKHAAAYSTWGAPLASVLAMFACAAFVAFRARRAAGSYRQVYATSSHELMETDEEAQSDEPLVAE